MLATWLNAWVSKLRTLAFTSSSLGDRLANIRNSAARAHRVLTVSSVGTGPTPEACRRAPRCRLDRSTAVSSRPWAASHSARSSTRVSLPSHLQTSSERPR
eukprot:7492001-Pyramimonas_sp.AAC.1